MRRSNMSTAILKAGGLGAMALMLAGCGTKDRVVFVTGTTVGVGFDNTTQSVNIGYDRNEVVIGPAYVETGALPPVIASLKSDLSPLAPTVEQLYATGDAAKLVTTDKTEAIAKLAATAAEGEVNRDELRGARRTMVFGTTASVGLKVGMSSASVVSADFAYKRRELSILPLREREETVAAGENNANLDQYGSALASIKVGANVDPQNTKMKLNQFFATGRAADNLAATNNTVRGAYAEIAEQAIRAQKTLTDLDRLKTCTFGSDGAFSGSEQAKFALLVDETPLDGAAAAVSGIKANFKAKVQDAATMQSTLLGDPDAALLMAGKMDADRTRYCDN